MRFENTTVIRNERTLLNQISWSVNSDERWVILGPNGAGKTTLLNIATAHDYPSRGTVKILDSTLGKVDVFGLRTRIGFASSAQAARIPTQETVLNTVLTAAYAVEGRWTEEYDEQDIKQAQRVLKEWGLQDLADRSFGTLSDGERKRTLIARAVMTDPEILLLDEPAANLDLGARENLVEMLSGFAASEYSPAMVMVTHHVEEIPRGFTHLLLLKNGEVVVAGPINETLTDENLSKTFDVKVSLTESDGRYHAFAK